MSDILIAADDRQVKLLALLVLSTAFDCVDRAGLLILKYRVLLILYRRYFLNIDGVIANTSEKSY